MSDNNVTTNGTSSPNQTMSELSKHYLSVLGHASSYSAAWLRPISDEGHDEFTLTVARNTRDVDENTMRSYMETHSLSSSSGKSIHHNTISFNKPVIYDISSTSSISISFFNTPINTKNGTSATGSYIEINHPEYGMYRIDTSSHHGKVIGDTWFGGLSWSYDEKYVTYVAQLKTNPNRTKTAVDAIDTFTGLMDKDKVDFLSSTIVAADSNLNADKKYMSSKFDYVDDWGEKYVDVSDLGIFVVDIFNGQVTQLPGIDISRYTVGQPQFVSPSTVAEEGAKTKTRSGYHIAYTAWSIQPRRLGMIYCYQRPCQIFLSCDLTHLLNSSSTTAAGATTISSNDPKDSNHWLVSRNLALARSARVSSFDGNTLVFLGNEKGFLSHNGCVSLYKMNIHDLMKSEPKSDNVIPVWQEVISVVDIPSQGADGTMQFPGIFCDQLPRSCFLSQDTVLFTSSWGGRDALLVVSLQSKKVVEVEGWFSGTVSCKYALPCIQLLDVYAPSADGKNNRVVTSYSTPTSSFQLLSFSINWSENSETYVAKEVISIKTKGKTNSVSTTTGPRYNVSSKLAVPSVLSSSVSTLDGVNWKYFEHRDESSSIPFASFVLYPTTTVTSGLPVILVPHGGPHSVTPTSFVAAYYFLCKSLQAVIVHVNYRGSTGFGHSSVISLTDGHCGRQDVDDMMYALRHASALYVDPVNNHELVTTTTVGFHKLVNDAQVAVVGGSHGGYLASHLCGQYPEVFKACCLRNPVTNIGAMTTVTDIPDWCHVEGLPASEVPSLYPAAPPSPEQLTTMYQASPVAYLHQYKTPTLICLGAKDRRVPASQGIEFYHMLRQRNVATRLMVFPEDVHAIDNPTSEAEHWIAIAYWLHSFLNL